MDHPPPPPPPLGCRARDCQHPGVPGKRWQSRCIWLLSAKKTRRWALRKAPSSATTVAFVLNGITVRVWFSLGELWNWVFVGCDVSVKYLPSLKDQCFACALSFFHLLWCFWLLKPGCSGNVRLDFGFLPVIALWSLLCSARRLYVPVCTSSCVTGLSGSSNKLIVADTICKIISLALNFSENVFRFF